MSILLNRTRSGNIILSDFVGRLGVISSSIVYYRNGNYPTDSLKFYKNVLKESLINMPFDVGRLKAIDLAHPNKENKILIDLFKSENEQNQDLLEYLSGTLRSNLKTERKISQFIENMNIATEYYLNKSVTNYEKKMSTDDLKMMNELLKIRDKENRYILWNNIYFYSLFGSLLLAVFFIYIAFKLQHLK